ncbi:EAL domain-containing protein [Actinotalea sp. Marseille-Q4924]|uniref:sensor domain-containing protein n=1 Tax=Actinotalea sp. Marseille-Q4924 TaxID=2866571 RepID=UPI002714713E|nr:EAL domain-containing protein [Actinotalea sp. Marseille-Q4924]
MAPQLQRAVINSLPAQLAVLDGDGTIVSVNDAWRRFADRGGCGCCSEDVNFFEVCDRAMSSGDPRAAADAALAAEGVRQVLEGAIPEFTMDVSCRAPAGTLWFTEQAVRYTAGDRPGVVLSYTDITARKEMEDAARHMATHDVLTGLPNRTLVADRLTQALAVARRTGAGVAILFCDVDHFKEINDRLGHAAGDAVLVEVGRRLRSCVREGDTVGRWSGDEFVVVCPNGEQEPAAERERAGEEVVGRIEGAMAAPVEVAGSLLTVELSVGLHVAGPKDRSADEVVDLADAAMLHVKGRRRAAALAGAPTATAVELGAADGEARVVQRLLHLLRRTAGMEVAWTSEFHGATQVLRFVDVAPGVHGPLPGTELPLSGGYCARVLAGVMPSVIPDTHLDPEAVLLPVTQELRIGAYLGVPLVGADGTVEGMVCATSSSAQPDLSADDVATARLIADVIQDVHRRALSTTAAQRRRRALHAEVADLCRGRGRHVVLQPVVELATGRTDVREALSRFDDTSRSPAQWFATASAVGLGHELEVAAAASALELTADGAPPVAVNLSPDVIVAGALDRLLAGVDPHDVVVEVTEHAAVESYGELDRALAPHRRRGLRVAVDDVGAGYASMAHVVRMHPDMIKIDMSLVRGIDEDPVRQALVQALGTFGRRLGAVVVAEGVETEEERDALLHLGIGHAQGFLFGRPATP